MEKFLIILFLSFTAPVYSKTLIISDIDDTLKASHVRSLVDVVRNSMNTSIAFDGMSELFNFFSSEIEESSFYYVSNAPKWAMELSHSTLLHFNRFPQGQVYLRDYFASNEHKFVIITQLIELHRPDKVVLFGDNGESDILYYDEVSRWVKKYFPQIELVQFIHHIYEGNGILSETADQIPYVAAVEVLSSLKGLQLFNFNLNNMNKMATHLSLPILNGDREEDSLIFPNWLECYRHIPENNFSQNALVDQAFIQIEKVCQDRLD